MPHDTEPIIGKHEVRITQVTQYWSLSSKQTLFNIVHFARGLDVLTTYDPHAGSQNGRKIPFFVPGDLDH